MHKRKFDVLINETDAKHIVSAKKPKQVKVDTGQIHPFFDDSKTRANAEPGPPFLPQGKEYTENGGEILLKLRDGSPALVRHKRLPKGMANELYLHLRNKSAIEFTQKEASKKFQFKKSKPPLEPRLTAGFTSDPKKKFSYSGQIVTGVPFTEPIQNLVNYLHTNYATPGCTRSNFVFGNEYDDEDIDKMEEEQELGQHHMSEHSDDDTSTNVCQPIWSVSIGTPRVFQVMVARKVHKAKTAKHKNDKKTTSKRKQTLKDEALRESKVVPTSVAKQAHVKKIQTKVESKLNIISNDHHSFTREQSSVVRFINKLRGNDVKPLFIPRRKLYEDYVQWRTSNVFITTGPCLHLSEEDFAKKALEYLFQNNGNYYFYQTSIHLHSTLAKAKPKSGTDDSGILQTEKKQQKPSTRTTPRRKHVIKITLRHGDVLVMYGRPTPDQDGMQQIYSHMVLAPKIVEMIQWKREDCRFKCRFNLTARSLR